MPNPAAGITALVTGVGELVSRFAIPRPQPDRPHESHSHMEVSWISLRCRAELLANRRKRTTPRDRCRTFRSAAHSLQTVACAWQQVVQACARGDLITSYEALPSEPPTAALNEALTAAGAQVAIPVHAIDGDALDDMQWRDLVTGQLVASTSDELVAHGSLSSSRRTCRRSRRLQIGQGKGLLTSSSRAFPQFPAGPLRVGIVEPASVFDLATNG